jgi:hypothetical protein
MWWRIFLIVGMAHVLTRRGRSHQVKCTSQRRGSRLARFDFKHSEWDIFILFPRVLLQCHRCLSTGNPVKIAHSVLSNRLHRERFIVTSGQTIKLLIQIAPSCSIVGLKISSELNGEKSGLKSQSEKDRLRHWKVSHNWNRSIVSQSSFLLISSFATFWEITIGLIGRFKDWARA